MLKRLFGLNPPKVSFRVVCPFCMTLTTSDAEIDKCPQCNLDMPPLYKHAAYKETPLPPFFLQVGGYSQAGKSVWLSALTLMIMRMARLWPGFFHQAATQETLNFIKDVNQFVSSGILPQPTPLGEQQAYLMILNQMASWSGRSLVVRDCSGESFTPMGFTVANMPYFLHVPTTMLFFSLNDMENNGDTMDRLLANYIHTLLSNKIKLKHTRRNIVVVLSKADTLVGLPNNLRDYLANDPLWTDLSSPGIPKPLDVERMDHYMKILANVSEAVANWLMYRDASAAGFIAMANANNIQLRFTLVSSLGAPPNAQGAIETFSPRRVLDPFFWAMEFERSAR